jgi:hypothetical protein
MFAPNTREPQKIPGSQIIRGLRVGCVVRDSQTAGA